MKQFIEFVVKAFVSGLLILVPVYLAVLLLLKAMQSLVGFVRPFAMLLPEWFPAEHVLSLILVLVVCFLIGVAVRTPAGRVIRERIEKSLFERIPGYALFRSLTQRLAGKDDEENVWKPALVEIEEALVPRSLLKNWRTGASRFSYPRCPRPSRAPSISSPRSGCILWMSLSLRRSSLSPGGDQVQRTLSQQ